VIDGDALSIGESRKHFNALAERLTGLDQSQSRYAACIDDKEAN
jgi:hypothetical protein